MAHRAASVNDLQRRFFTSRIQALHRKQLLIGEKKPRKLLRGPILRQPVRPRPTVSLTLSGLDGCTLSPGSGLIHFTSNPSARGSRSRSHIPE